MSSLVFTLALLVAMTASAAPQRSAWDGSFTAAQAARGQAAYREDCARCHGQNLGGGESSPALAGQPFVQRWSGKSVTELLEYTRRTMPMDNPGGLGTRRYADIVAYVLSVNRAAAGKRELGGGAPRV